MAILVQPIPFRSWPHAPITASALTSDTTQQHDRNIFYDAAGIPYIVGFAPGVGGINVIETWKGNAPNPTSWSLIDGNNSPRDDNTTFFYRASSAIMDKAGVIHICYLKTVQSGVDVELRYVQIVGGLYVGDTVLVTGAGPHNAAQYHTVRVALDSNDKIHIAWNNTRLANRWSTPTYINNVAGSWSSPIALTPVENEQWALHAFVIDNNNLPIVTARKNISGQDPLHAYRGDANNPSSFTGSGQLVTDVHDAGQPRIGTICVDSGNNVYAGYIKSDDTITLLKQQPGDGWATWQTPINLAGVVASHLWVVPIGLDIYVFWRDSSSSGFPGLRFVVYSNGVFGRIRTLIGSNNVSSNRPGWSNYGYRSKDGQLYEQATPTLPSIAIRYRDTDLNTRVLSLDLAPVALGGELRATGSPLYGAKLSSALPQNINIFASSASIQTTATAPPVGITLTADPGVFVLQGQAATLKAPVRITADTGAFTFQGQAATFTKGYTITADAGVFTLQGEDAQLARGFSMQADAGAFTLQGEDADFDRGLILPADAGVFALLGEAATFSRGFAITADAGVFTFLGESAGLIAATEQCLTPESDTDNSGGWIVSPLWSKIDDKVGTGDADQIQSPNNPGTQQPFTVKLTSNVSDPQASTGHTITIRAAKDANGGADYDLTTELRQGYVSEGSQGTLIATFTELFTNNTPSTRTYTLSGAEADSISNYSALYLRVFGNKSGGGQNRGLVVFDVEVCVPPGVGNVFSIPADPGVYVFQGEEATLFKTIPGLAADSGVFNFLGQDATFTIGRVIIANAGIFTLQGEDADFLETNTLQADPGVYVFQGEDADFDRGLVLLADPGIFTLIGEDADFDRGLVLLAEEGQFNLEGEEATFVEASILLADPGVFLFQGEDVQLGQGLVLLADPGVFTFTGEDAILTETNELAAEAGVFVFTGEDATLSAAITLAADAGVFTFTGEDAIFLETNELLAEAGVFNFEGEEAILTETNELAAEAGVFNFEGEEATFGGNKQLTADAGVFNFDGEEAGLLFSTLITAESGTFNFEGEDAIFPRDYILIGEEGEFNFEGAGVFLAKNLFIAAEHGEFILQGEDADLRFFRVDAEAGEFNFEGEDAVLLFAGLTQADPGEFNFEGEDANFTIDRSINCEPGVFILKGEAACLEWLRKGRYEKYECFTLPFIGAKGACENLEPTSGLWINSLPGITLKRLTKIVNEGDLTAERFFRRIEKAALDRLTSDVISGLAEDYQFNSVLDHINMGLKDDGYAAKQSIQRRTRIWKKPDDFLSLRIEKIRLRADADVTTKVYIDDGFQDIAEFVIELKAGKTGTLVVDYETREDYTDVYFDSACANFSEIEDCYEGTSYIDLEHSMDCGSGFKPSPGAIGLRVSVFCDSCELLSSHMDALALPALYMTGILIMQEVVNSDRVNPYIRNNKKEARKMLFHWYGGLDEQLLLSKKTGEYHKVLAGAIRQIRNHVRRIDSDCVSCEGPTIVC